MCVNAFAFSSVQKQTLQHGYFIKEETFVCGAEAVLECVTASRYSHDCKYLNNFLFLLHSALPLLMQLQIKPRMLRSALIWHDLHDCPKNCGGDVALFEHRAGSILIGQIHLKVKLNHQISIDALCFPLVVLSKQKEGFDLVISVCCGF